MSVIVSTGLINPALRIAGITKRPMRTPSSDQSAEALAVLIRMIASWNVDRLAIFTRSITQYEFTVSKMTYTIGPSGADFTAPGPLEIKRARIVYPTDPPIFSPLEILDDVGWEKVRLQLLPNIIPQKLYPDYAWPLCNLNLVGQPIVGYSLELDTESRVQTFATTGDTVVLPDGYERAIVYNLALELAASYPDDAHLAPEAPDIAAQSLAIIQSRNARVPKLTNDAAGLGSRIRGESRWWLTGGYTG